MHCMALSCSSPLHRSLKRVYCTAAKVLRLRTLKVACVLLPKMLPLPLLKLRLAVVNPGLKPHPSSCRTRDEVCYAEGHRVEWPHLQA